MNVLRRLARQVVTPQLMGRAVRRPRVSVSGGALVLGSLVLYTVPQATAQVIGAKLGANSARLAETSGLLGASAFGGRIGLVAGVTFAVDLGSVVGIQFEGLYAEKGTASGGMRMRSRYLEVPILITATLPTRALVRPMVVAGVAPSIELACGGWTQQGHVPEVPPPPPESLDCATMRTNRDDLGGVLGVGVDVGVSPWSLTAEFRYTESLTNIGRHFELGTVHNRTFALLVGTAIQISGL